MRINILLYQNLETGFAANAPCVKDGIEYSSTADPHIASYEELAIRILGGSAVLEVVFVSEMFGKANVWRKEVKVDVAQHIL